MNNNFEKENNMLELNKLIDMIQLKYNYVDASWKKSNDYRPLNMKKKKS